MKVSVLLICAVALANTSCVSQTQKNSAPAAEHAAEKPALPPAKRISEGVLLHEVQFGSGAAARKVWIYLPEKAAAGKLPVVLIAAAGSRLIDGAELGDGSRPEHLPYVKAGFAVVAYGIDGATSDMSEEATVKAATAFMKSRAGLENQRQALDYTLAVAPALDPQRVYAAGHSSAATHALFAAANEPRIKAVAAYAPAADVPGFIGDGLSAFDDHIPGFSKFIAESSPSNNTAKITVPVLLFHSRRDEVVPARMTEGFADALRRTNRSVTLATTEKGGHYDSMISEGIPQGVKWFSGLAGLSAAAVAPKTPPDGKQILAEVRRIVAEVLGVQPQSIDPDSPLAKQKADELDVVEIVMGVEESFGIEITDEELGFGGDLDAATKITPKQLAALVDKKKTKR